MHRASAANDSARTEIPQHSPEDSRQLNLDSIVWMRDVVTLTGAHRCTIHRWIRRGKFPAKDAPRENPVGWLRSTIERWLNGK